MRLVSGAGSEKTGACWMSAIHYYTRKDMRSWTDHPDCVSGVVRTLAIRLNDYLGSDKERENVIGPHLFTPVGTKTTDEDEQKRREICRRYVIRIFAPFWLRRTKKAKLIAHAEQLEKIPLSDMAAVTKAANAACAAADAAACAAANAAAYAAANAANAAYAAADAAAYAADASADAADAKPFVIKHLLACILECCAVGQKAEVRNTVSKSCLLEFLNK